MNEKDLMENLLQLQKGVCDLYMHATVESSTANVHSAFCEALNSALKAQNTIYSKMAANGWYKTDQADAAKLTAAKNQFSMAKA